jgi:hypothetical protein
MMGMALAKSLYAIPTWTRTVGLVLEHPWLIAALGAETCPSVYACYRFATKLREHGHLLDACIAAALGRLREANPELGANVAIDASDMPAYTPRWQALYRRRSAVEREFGRLKNEWALAPLRVRRIERVRVHADLTILAKLSSALCRATALKAAA